MKVGWLVDDAPYEGGAELTMADFFRAAPDDVELVRCPPGKVYSGMDTYVIGNCVTYRGADLDQMNDKAPVVKYVNDVWPYGDPEVRHRLCQEATLIFCSPLHRERFPWPVELPSHIIPPALDLSPPPEGAKREGTIWLGRMYPGKGVAEACEWAEQNDERIDFYGYGPIIPHGRLVDFKGKVEHKAVRRLLATYERLVFLPTEVEPFGRTVAEAWAAGVPKIVTNGLVGAVHYLEHERDALDSAADDFWEVVSSVSSLV